MSLLQIPKMDAAQIRRVRPGTWSAATGHYTEASPVTTNILASVQPATGDEIVMEPEADRDREQFVVFMQAFALVKADILLYHGDEYRFLKAESWTLPTSREVYSKGTAVKIDASVPT